MSTIHSYVLFRAAEENSLSEAMLDASSYWQPDGQSSEQSSCKHAWLGKAHLFNLPGSQSDRVWRDPHGHVIAAHVRLDNKAELRERLGIRHQEYTDLSESQLILLAFRKWGEECPKFLLGDFVFIIWNQKDGSVFAARDHFGVHSLYYSVSNRGLMLSSEINAFFKSGWQEKKIREEWLVKALWSLPPRFSSPPFHGIDLLEAGHCLSAKLDAERRVVKISQTPYWTLQTGNQLSNSQNPHLLEELKEKFSAAVGRRLVSDFPICTELSEGLDSNAIAGFAARLLGNTPLYSVSYGGERLSSDNQHIWGDTYADIFEMLELHENLEPLWRTSKFNAFGSALERSPHLGGITASSYGFAATVSLAHESGCRTMLSGWGGDHCVSVPGDEYIQELIASHNYLKALSLLRVQEKRGRGANAFRALLAMLLKQRTPSLHRLLRPQGGRLAAALRAQARSSLLRQEWRTKYGLDEALEEFCQTYDVNKVADHHHRELVKVGVEERLRHAEACARYYRVNYRYPMLDKELVEFTLKLPASLKIYGGTERFPIRHILKGFTTERIRLRYKADVMLPPLEHLEDTRPAAVMHQLNKFVASPKIQDGSVGGEHAAAQGAQRANRAYAILSHELAAADPKIIP